MKLFTTFLLFFFYLSSTAQTFEGNWVGQVSNQSVSLQSEMIIKKINANQLEGELIVTSNGAKDVYTLKATVIANTAMGKLTYKVDGTIFDCSLVIKSQEIQQVISFQGQPILDGKYAKSNGSVATRETTKPDNLFRDPKLIGKWTYSENYSSSGGFYGSVNSTIILNADGTIDDGGATSYASGSGNSVMNKGTENQTIAQLKALNAKWFTKGNIFCWRIVINGKTTDVENAKYYIENGTLLLTDLQTGKKTLYQKQ